jgi:hypothetical protein
MEQQAWILTAGQYDDYHVLGVFFGTESQVLRKAQEMTTERATREWPHNVASDLVRVSIEKTEVL